jgi:hypothetical protein
MNLTDATAVYAGTTEAQAVYYGPQLLWNVPGWEPPPAFSPSSISGLRLWLDSSVGLYDATSGGNLVTTNSAAVLRWEDQSGNGFHATGASGPTFSLNQVNGKPSLVFSGSHFLQIPSILNGTSATAFVVVRPTNTGADGGALIGNIGPSNTHYPYRGGFIYDDFATTTRKEFITQPIGFYSWHLYNVLSEINNWQYIFNGALHFSTTSNTYTSGPQSTGPFIGRSTVGGIYSFLGSIAEIVVYNSSLTTEQREQVSEYLRAKYSLY